MAWRTRFFTCICAWTVGCAGTSTLDRDLGDPGSTAADVSPMSKAGPAAERHTVEVEGHPIAAWSKRPATPLHVLVLIHGRTWSTVPDFDLRVPGERRSLMDAFVEQGFAVYGVDLRGYGATPRDDTGWLTPDRAVADVAAVLSWVAARHPDLEKPTLLGWSMGSLVAQLVAQRHADGISALVLYGYPRDPEATHPPGPPAHARPPRRKTTAEAAAEDFITPEVVSQATIDAFVETALATDPIKVDWRATDELAALDPAAVLVPTLVIHGERDPYAPVEAQAKLFTRLGHPDRAWVIVAGGDHAAHLEDTGPRFVDAVVTFVRRPAVPVPGGVRARQSGAFVDRPRRPLYHHEMERGGRNYALWLAVVVGSGCRSDGDGSGSSAEDTGGIASLSGTAATETTESQKLDVAGFDIGGGSAGEGGAPETCKLVDVVLSVDNSGSMSEEIEALRGPVFDSFPQTLLDVGNGLDDFHLAVIDACNDPPHFHDWGDDGDCNFPGGVNFMTSNSPTLTDEYSCVTNLSTSGYMGMSDNCSGSNDDEQPANTAADAVSPPALDGPNAGFLRSDAILFVVAITDEDEQPVPAATPDEIAAKIVAAKGTIDNVVFLGIGGDSDCNGPYGSADEADVLREVTQIFVDAGRGVWWDLCQGDLETAFATALEIVDSACIDFNPVG